jgi:hypothetical protein
MSSEIEFPVVEVAVVLVERADLFLAEYNPRWEAFTLPMARLRRRQGGAGVTVESALDAAVRAAAKVLGRPLPPSHFPQPVALEVPPHTYLHSGRDQQTKRYTYRIFAMRVSEATPRHALGWHTLWMKRDAFLTHRPVSATAEYVMQHVSDDLFAK